MSDADRRHALPARARSCCSPSRCVSGVASPRLRRSWPIRRRTSPNLDRLEIFQPGEPSVLYGDARRTLRLAGTGVPHLRAALADPEAGPAGGAGCRGRPVLPARGHQPEGDGARRPPQPDLRQGEGGGQHHHPATRQEPLPESGADAQPQGEGDSARARDRAALQQGQDPGDVPEHHLLRRRGVRDRGRGADLLQQVRGASSTSPRPHSWRASSRRRASIRRSPILKRAKERRDYRPGAHGEGGAHHGGAGQGRHARAGRLESLLQGAGRRPYFVDYVRKELEPRYGRALLAQGGLRIYTTLDLEMQRAAADVLRNGVKGIEKTLAGKKKARQRDPAGAGGGPGGPGSRDGGDPGHGGRPGLRARASSTGPSQARRQPGSAFKPFVYAAAFERGFTPATLVDDFPISYSIPQNGQ